MSELCNHKLVLVKTIYPNIIIKDGKRLFTMKCELCEEETLINYKRACTECLEKLKLKNSDYCEDCILHTNHFKATK